MKVFTMYHKIDMNQSDINYIVKLLSSALKTKDWDSIEEALEYCIEFQDDPHFEEE